MSDAERVLDTSALTEAVAQHVAERGKLFNPAEARDRCRSESAAFMETLAGFGIEATVVSGFKMAGDEIMAGHFAVRVDDDVWDWTARQFDPSADVPLITPWAEWCKQWSNPTEGWLNPLADPVSLVYDMADSAHRSCHDPRSDVVTWPRPALVAWLRRVDGWLSDLALDETRGGSSFSLMPEIEAHSSAWRPTMAAW